MSRLKLMFIALGLVAVLISCSKMDSSTLARVGESTISLDAFTSTNPASRFVGKDNDFIDSKVDEYVKRELFTLAAYDRGYDKDPTVAEKQLQTEHRHMLQYVYDKAIMDEVITEASLRELFDRTGVELNAKHILVQFAGGRSQATRSKAEAMAIMNEIKARLAKGESFEDLAAKLTEDPSGKSTGGDLGWFGWGKMVGPFQEAAFSLKPGDMSDVVETDFGYHIIKLEGRRDVERGSFEDEKPRLRQEARRGMNAELSRRANAFLDGLKEKAGFKLYTENLHIFFEIFNGSTVKALPMDEVFFHLSFSDPLFTLNGEDIDYRWIIAELKKVEQDKKPRFHSESQLLTILDQLVIQYLIVDYGYEQNYNQEEVFISKVNDYTRRFAYNAFMEKEVNSASEPSEEDLTSYYEKNKNDKFLDKKKVKVIEIFVKDSLLAVDLKKRIDAGENIGALAGRYTERKAVKDNNGEIPAFQEGRYGAMGKMAFSMSPGEIAGPVVLGGGYSIIKLTDLVPEQAKSFKSVQSRIKNAVVSDLRKARSDELFKELKKSFPVKVNYTAVYDFYAASNKEDS